MTTSRREVDYSEVVELGSALEYVTQLEYLLITFFGYCAHGSAWRRRVLIFYVCQGKLSEISKAQDEFILCFMSILYQIPFGLMFHAG